MKRIFLSSLAAVLMAAKPGDANAQRRIVPFIGGGLAAGTGDLGENTDNGWLVFGGVDLPLGSTPGLKFGVTASYARVPYQGSFDEYSGVAGLFGEVGYTFWAASPRIVKPYVRAGGGVQMRKYDPGSTGYREQSDGGLAFSGGGGLEFLVSSAAIIAGAHFVSDADAGVLAFHAGVAFPGRAPSAKR